MATKRSKIKKTKISAACKAAAKKKFKVWPSAYASGWGVRCTKAGGPANYGGKSKDGASTKDPDIKAAKKKIRKGANVLGGGNIIDDFGREHGYQSDKTNALDNTRLVQRKKRQYRKEEAKSNIKGYRGKEARQGFKNDPFFEGKGNEIRKQEIKDLKQTTKNRNKVSKKYAKANRIVSKAKKM
jgi:hypothetical protein